MGENLNRNKENAISFYRMAFDGNPRKAVELFVGSDYIQHNPLVGDGKEPFIKYFETVAAGALLIGQYCQDLELLGFQDGYNCIIFNKENFKKKVKKYLINKKSYLEIRKQGIRLIKERHTIEKRVDDLKDHLYKQING